jgi:hypothetical protein
VKHDAFNHPKFTLAAQDLGISLAHLRGILVSLWNVADTHHPDGGVGRFTNEELLVAIGEQGDGDRLVSVLVSRRLLDEVPREAGRLYIHDWHDHCQDHTRQKLRNRKQTFANGMAPYGTTEKPKESTDNGRRPQGVNGTEQASTENHREPQRTTENDSTKPKPKPYDDGSKYEEPERALAAAGDPDFFEQAGQFHRDHRRLLYSFLVSDLTGRQLDDYLTQIASHLEAGAPLTGDLLKQAVGRAKSEWAKQVVRKPPGIGWVLNAIRDLLLEAEPLAGAASEPRRLERPDAVSLQGWRSRQRRHAAMCEWAEVDAAEEAHRDALQRLGWPQDAIEREIQADRREVGASLEEQGWGHVLAARPGIAAPASTTN